MPISEQKSPKSRPPSVSTAEAFYVLFRALPKKEKIAVARYILQDDEVQKSANSMVVPNETTLKSFQEDKAGMPVFHSIDDLRKDLLS